MSPLSSMSQSRREKVWVVLSDYDGVEGPVYVVLLGARAPLFSTDPKNLESLRELAEKISKAEGRPTRVAEFTQRTDLFTF